MNLRQLNKKARVVRRIVAPATLGLQVTDGPESVWWPMGLTEPDGTPAGTDESPREDPPYTVRYTEAFGKPPGPPLRAGERVEVQSSGGVYELLSAPRPLRVGERVVGWEAPALPVGTLYPLTAELKEQGGVTVAAEVPMAVFGGDESTTERGEYEDREAEVPSEFRNDLTSNRFLVLDDVKMKITESIVDRKGPRVKLTVRIPRG